MTRREVLTALAGAPALFAQSPQKEQKGRELLAATLEALGGNAFLGMQDRTESGRAYSFYRDRLTGLARATIYTRYVTAPTTPEPNKVYQRERQAFGKDKDYAILFDEGQGLLHYIPWSPTPPGRQPHSLPRKHPPQLL